MCSRDHWRQESEMSRFGEAKSLRCDGVQMSVNRCQNSQSCKISDAFSMRHKLSVAWCDHTPVV